MSSEATQLKTINIFCSYAHADKKLADQLQATLSSDFTFKQQNIALLWSDGDIKPGEEWKDEIENALREAQIILLLVSTDFMASEYCYNVEMPLALQHHKNGEARVIPIILRPVLWQGSPLSNLQALPTGGKPVISWRNRDEAFVNIAVGIRHVIEELLAKDPIPAIIPTTTWYMPHLRNSYFTGREALLTGLHKQLKKTHTVTLTQSIDTSGLGGIGKTQTAIEYAYRYRDEYSFVLWAQAASLSTLSVDFMAIAQLLQIPEKDQLDQQIIVAAVKRWLTEHTDWLLILDNADDLALVYNFLPIGDTGHILLTTHNQEVGTGANRSEITAMGPEDGALLLLRRSQIIKPDAVLKEASGKDRLVALDLGGDLAWLPLALDLAGAFIAETKRDLLQYKEIYAQSRKSHFKRIYTSYPTSIVTTVQLSFSRIEQLDPNAAEVLRLCAFLAPDAIPEEIISENELHSGSAIDPKMRSLILAVLQNYSLIQRNEVQGSFSIHPLIQAVIREGMGTIQHRYAKRIVHSMSAFFSSLSNNERETLYLPHAYACVALIETYKLHSLEAANLLRKVGKFFYEHALYEEAKPLYVKALEMYEEVLGPKDCEVANVLSELAQLCLATDSFKEAEFLFKHALSILRMKETDPDRLTFATILSSLAQLYQRQGKYEESARFYEEALQIYEMTLGPEHPSTAQALHNLATLYQDLKKYKEAEALYQRALAIEEKTLGPEHPSTAQTLNDLAVLYQDEKWYKEAEALYQRALAIRQRVLGPEHSSTAQTLNNLAVLYDSQEKLELAEILYKRALAIYERTLGPNHPHTALNLRNLAGLYQNQGKLAEADELYKRASAILGDGVTEPSV